MTVTPETARRLKEAGFPQPEFPQPGFVFYGNSNKRSHLVFDNELCCSYKNGVRLFVERYKIENLVFAPTATDIMQHLPGWALVHVKGEWICYNRSDEFSEFAFDTNPAEAAAKAWFFEQSHAKK